MLNIHTRIDVHPEAPWVDDLCDPTSQHHPVSCLPPFPRHLAATPAVNHTCSKSRLSAVNHASLQSITPFAVNHAAMQ